jgi:hypothetical protein
VSGLDKSLKTRVVLVLGLPTEDPFERLLSAAPGIGRLIVRFWMGTEGQEFCILLLRKRYGDHSFEDIPDGHNGD